MGGWFTYLTSNQEQVTVGGRVDVLIVPPEDVASNARWSYPQTFPHFRAKDAFAWLHVVIVFEDDFVFVFEL